MKIATLASVLVFAGCLTRPLVQDTTTEQHFGATEQGTGESDYFPNVGEYEASPEQLKADQSFSDILIETPRQDVEDRLMQIVENGCEPYAECDWSDAAGVRHYFFWVREDQHLLVVKSVLADEFVGRPIPALGIGMARSQEYVMANVRAFLPEVVFECTSDGDLVGCHEQVLRPGWLRIWFENGQLKEVRLDGYHFT